MLFCAVDGDIPEKSGLLTGYFPVHSFADTPKEGYDCIIAVDAGDLGGWAFGALFEAMGKPSLSTIMGPTSAMGNIISSGPMGATGQIILELLEAMRARVDENMSNALYAAISTDTGNFRIPMGCGPCCTRRPVCGSRGGHPHAHGRTFILRSLGATKLLGQALERLQLHCGGRIASLHVLQADYAACGAVKGLRRTH